MNGSVITSAAEPARIGYVLKMFPRLSETFILNEILELEIRCRKKDSHWRPGPETRG